MVFKRSINKRFKLNLVRLILSFTIILMVIVAICDWLFLSKVPNFLAFIILVCSLLLITMDFIKPDFEYKFTEHEDTLDIIDAPITFTLSRNYAIIQKKHLKILLRDKNGRYLSLYYSKKMLKYLHSKSSAKTCQIGYMGFIRYVLVAYDDHFYIRKTNEPGYLDQSILRNCKINVIADEKTQKKTIEMKDTEGNLCTLIYSDKLFQFLNQNKTA